jgi:imidazolonepropionase-like amidohydrolase
MKEKGVAYCPTLAATASVQQYRGWKKGLEPEPPALVNKRQSFAAALKAGVTICMGGDVGVFAHGNNALEMEMMVDYGMPAMAVLKSATSVNADVFGLSDRLGRIRPGLLADLLVVDGNPVEDISRIRAVSAVMKDGKWVK